MLGWGPTLLQSDLTLTDDICNNYFQIRLHSEVLGIMISTYAYFFWGGHSLSRNIGQPGRTH